MNTDRLTTILGIIGGFTEVLASSGVLGENRAIADIIFAISMGTIGYLTNKPPEAER